MGAESAGRPLAEWIRANGAPVDPALWSESSGSAGRVWRRELFDLKPGTGLVPAS